MRYILIPLVALLLCGKFGTPTIPHEPSERAKLLRQVALDLLGQTLTPAQIAEFDRLLASPTYGERSGKHWLDVARSADMQGVEPSPADLARIRAWVIKSFNDEIPFPAFNPEK